MGSGVPVCRQLRSDKDPAPGENSNKRSPAGLELGMKVAEAIRASMAGFPPNLVAWG